MLRLLTRQDIVNVEEVSVQPPAFREAALSCARG